MTLKNMTLKKLRNLYRKLARTDYRTAKQLRLQARRITEEGRGMSKTSHGCYVVCPHCGYEHGDAWEMFQFPDVEREFTCNGCEVEFVCWVEAPPTYYARQKADSKP